MYYSTALSTAEQHLAGACSLLGARSQGWWVSLQNQLSSSIFCRPRVQITREAARAMQGRSEPPLFHFLSLPTCGRLRPTGNRFDASRQMCRTRRSGSQGTWAQLA